MEFYDSYVDLISLSISNTDVHWIWQDLVFSNTLDRQRGGRGGLEAREAFRQRRPASWLYADDRICLE